MTTFSRRQFLESAGLAAAVPALDAVAGQRPATPGAIDVEKDVVFGKDCNTKAKAKSRGATW